MGQLSGNKTRKNQQAPDSQSQIWLVLMETTQPLFSLLEKGLQGLLGNLVPKEQVNNMH